MQPIPMCLLPILELSLLLERTHTLDLYLPMNIPAAWDWTRLWLILSRTLNLFAWLIVAFLRPHSSKLALWAQIDVLASRTRITSVKLVCDNWFLIIPQEINVLSVWGQLFFMLVLKIEASKLPRNDLKNCQRHRYDPSVWRSALVCPSKTKK